MASVKAQFDLCRANHVSAARVPITLKAGLGDEGQEGFGTEQ